MNGTPLDDQDLTRTLLLSLIRVALHRGPLDTLEAVERQLYAVEHLGGARSRPRPELTPTLVGTSGAVNA